MDELRRLRFPLILLLLTLLLPSACQGLPTSILPPDDGSTPAGNLALVINTPTPAPTATPGLIEEAVSKVAVYTGVDRVSVLGLTGEDWMNVGISLLIILLGYLAGTVLVRFILPPLVRRATAEVRDIYATIIAPNLRWLVVIFTLNFAIRRLALLTPEVKRSSGNIFFILGLIILLRVVWKLVDFAEQWYRQEKVPPDALKGLDPVIILLRRVTYIIIVLIGLSLLLARFGLNTSALTITLGLIGLALSLGTQDTLSDAISGFLILADQPFRVGDTIEVEAINDWGIVNRIGLRTTHILTYDNRVVIIPNSSIGKSVVINYTYPDPRYRVETLVRVPYGTNIRAARQVITETIHQVEGVLPDESVEVLCHEMGEFAMVLRVRWWIHNYNDVAIVRDRVIEAVQEALSKNSFRVAHPIRDLNLRVVPETMTQLSQALREHGSERKGDE